MLSRPAQAAASPRPLAAFVRSQRRWARAFERRFVGERLRRDGHKDFCEVILPGLIAPGMRIAEVGGGKRPYLAPKRKRKLGCTVIGIDIDAAELAAAPAGAYDRVIAADICRTTLPLDADLVICSAVLEHVRDAPAALVNIVRLARPGGRVAAFLPCRNAPFAVLNRALPERLKRRLLGALFPKLDGKSGFRAYYDMATPGLYRRWAAAEGVVVEDLRTYHSSGYFHAFFPAYLLWRLWSAAAARFFPERGAESFVVVLRRPP